MHNTLQIHIAGGSVTFITVQYYVPNLAGLIAIIIISIWMGKFLYSYKWSYFRMLIMKSLTKPVMPWSM